MIISNIDYKSSTQLTVEGECPLVSHGLHTIANGESRCETCGIESCKLLCHKGDTHPAITGWNHMPMENNGYLVKGNRGSLLITAASGTEAMAIYMHS